MDKSERRVCLAVEPSPVEGEWSFYIEADKDTVPIIRMTTSEFRVLVKRLAKRLDALKLDHDMGKPLRRQVLRLGKGDKAVTLSPYSVTTADFNGDGRLDLVTGGYSVTGSVSVLVGNGSNTSLLPVLNLNYQTQARQVIDQMTTALQPVTSEHGVVGAVQSRLSTDASNVQQMRDSYVAASSRITDIGVAQESADLLRTQLLQQAGAAILAQADCPPRLPSGPNMDVDRRFVVVLKSRSARHPSQGRRSCLISRP
jgi:flagellin-like hook-associated protein FlgL